MDGEITIGTKLSTDKFDRQITDLEKKMQKEEDKKIKISSELTNIQEEKAKYEELKKEAESYQNVVDKIRNTQSERYIQGLKPLELTEHAQNIVDRYNELQGKIYENANAMSKLTTRENKLLEQQNQINARVTEYKQKIENVKIQKHVAEVERMKDSFKNVGNSIQTSINKVSRLALGIFGIRSAFMFLRRASSDLATYDQQYATNLEYIRYALTQMIAPVLQWIVNLTAKLLGYINAIMQGWFGINLFSRGSAESFNKMKAGASGTSKAVKEIKKQLAGFDEINMLTDQSDTGTKSGAGGVGVPSFDLSGMQGEPPEWLKWIIDNKDLILSVIAGAIAGITALKLGLDGIKSLGIGLMIAGIIYTIQSLIEYLNNPSWENFGKIIQGVGVAIVGLGALIGSVPLAVAGAIVLIVGTIVKYWEQIKSFFQKGIDWLKGKSDWVHEMFGDVIGSIYDIFVEKLQLILDLFDLMFNTIKNVFDGIIKVLKGIFTGDWEMAWEGIFQIFSSIWNLITQIFEKFVPWALENLIYPLIDIFSKFGEWIASLGNNLWQWFLDNIEKIKEKFGWLGVGIVSVFVTAFDWVTKLISGFVQIFKNALDGIFKGVKLILDGIVKIFKGDFKGAIVSITTGIANSLIGILNGLISGVNAIAYPLRAIITAVGNVLGQNWSIESVSIPKIPYLKTGAIVNMPNKGTLVGGGSARAGEAGKEGILPLDDRTTMAELGAEIGKHVLINLTNITQMNGRVIGRELKQIKSEQEFGFNT